jgi:hypothetical protein
MTRRRSEQGATAVLVALMASALFGIGAIAVDMGQAYALRRDLQTNVDLAVMAAAGELNGELADGGRASARAAAERYLTTNEVTGQIPWHLDLDAPDPRNDRSGYLQFDADGNAWKIRLYAPKVNVDLGLANIFGPAVAGIRVPANAAAEIRSPGTSMMPMYAVGGGCDYGDETISDEPSTPTTRVVPPLLPTTDPAFNAATFAISPTEVSGSSAYPLPMTLSGTGLDRVTQVGFTTAGGDHFIVDDDGDGNDFTISGSTSITLDSVPSDVLAQEDFWFVRVFRDGTWSQTATAQMFTVGDRLYCSGSTSGNFGSLRVPRTDSPPSQWLERNIVLGVEPDLAVHPSPPLDHNCKGDPSPTVESERGPVDGTNCLATDPGFPTEALTDGLITGSGSALGRLDAETTSGCGRGGTSDRTVATSTGEKLNDDLLTCFITNDTTRISQLVTGSAENVLSADIFGSPRFFWIPVISTEPSAGASARYPIVDLRAGFITDQPLIASRLYPYESFVSPYAGVTFHSNQVSSLKVVLFDADALPETAAPTGDEVAYTGSGTRVLTLVE